MCVGVADGALVVEGVRAGVAGFGGAVDDCVAAEAPGVGVQPAVTGVVADFAVGGAELEVVDVGQQGLEERFAADAPSDSARVEETEAVAFAEFLGAVVGAVVFHEVASVEVVGGTEHPVFTVAWDFAAVGVFLAAPYACGAYGVLAELASPVELELVVDVALCLPVGHFACTQREVGLCAVVEAGSLVVVVTIGDFAGCGVDVFEHIG